MKGLILMHIDEAGVKLFDLINSEQYLEKGVGQLIEDHLNSGDKVYNFQPLEKPADFLEQYRSRIVMIPSEGLERFQNQFFEGKKVLIDEGIDHVAICGWNLGVCIQDMQGLLKAEDNLGIYARDLGWSQELYESVQRKKISVETLNQYCMH